jgi:hypothetical protein
MVGATIASLPFELPRERRSELVSTPALALIRTEIGDASETVRKSLSWALRSWREVDPRGVDELLESEARRASESNDGNRAWVIRDAMKEQRTPVPQPVQARIRTLLAGVRRAAGNQSTSEASQIAAKFVGFEGMSDSAVGIQGERQRMAVGR